MFVCSTFGSSVYTPAYPEVAARFHVSQTAALLPLTLWVLGLAAGPMIGAPLSETKGRVVVYRVTLPVSLLFTLGAGFSKNFATLLVCRFLAGVTGSPVLAVGAGTNADLYPPRYRAVSVSLFLVAPFAGPALG
jgi:MFS family permease